jgi:hypothetical protein
MSTRKSSAEKDLNTAFYEHTTPTLLAMQPLQGRVGCGLAFFQRELARPIENFAHADAFLDTLPSAWHCPAEDGGWHYNL